jgi:glucose uptake protein GlcU
MTVLSLIVVGVVSTSVPVFAQSFEPSNPKELVCSGIGTCNTNETQTRSVSGVLRTVINLLSIILGIIAVIMVIIGGIRYATSQGDGNSIASAKNTVIYALIGLIIAAVAQFLVRFVLSNIASQPPGPTSSLQTRV